MPWLKQWSFAHFSLHMPTYISNKLAGKVFSLYLLIHHLDSETLCQPFLSVSQYGWWNLQHRCIYYVSILVSHSYSSNSMTSSTWILSTISLYALSIKDSNKTTCVLFMHRYLYHILRRKGRYLQEVRNTRATMCTSMKKSMGTILF